jgi:putative transposase
MVTPAARRSAVVHAREVFGLSERRACSIVGIARRVVRYRSRRPDNAPIRLRLRELAAQRRRFGFRRLGLLLAREGTVLNRKKLLRLYREEKLSVRRRGGRKRAMGTRVPLAIPSAPNQCWALDFVSDAFSDGRRFRILTVVDAHTRECLGLVADTSLRAGLACLDSFRRKISGLPAGCRLILPMRGLMQGGRSPTGMRPRIGGENHAATAWGRLSK